MDAVDLLLSRVSKKTLDVMQNAPPERFPFAPVRLVQVGPRQMSGLLMLDEFGDLVAHAGAPVPAGKREIYWQRTPTDRIGPEVLPFPTLTSLLSLYDHYQSTGRAIAGYMCSENGVLGYSLHPDVLSMPEEALEAQRDALAQSMAVYLHLHQEYSNTRLWGSEVRKGLRGLRSAEVLAPVRFFLWDWDHDVVDLSGALVNPNLTIPQPLVAQLMEVFDRTSVEQPASNESDEDSGSFVSLLDINETCGTIVLPASVGQGTESPASVGLGGPYVIEENPGTDQSCPPGDPASMHYHTHPLINPAFVGKWDFPSTIDVLNTIGRSGPRFVVSSAGVMGYCFQLPSDMPELYERVGEIQAQLKTQERMNESGNKMLAYQRGERGLAETLEDAFTFTVSVGGTEVSLNILRYVLYSRPQFTSS